MESEGNLAEQKGNYVGRGRKVVPSKPQAAWQKNKNTLETCLLCENKFLWNNVQRHFDKVHPFLPSDKRDEVVIEMRRVRAKGKIEDLELKINLDRLKKIDEASSQAVPIPPPPILIPPVPAQDQQEDMKDIPSAKQSGVSTSMSEAPKPTSTTSNSAIQAKEAKLDHLLRNCGIPTNIAEEVDIAETAHNELHPRRKAEYAC